MADHLGLALDVRPGSNGQWAARCPGHDDAKRSLSLTIGSKGQRIVWKCHAGCEAGEVRRAMLAKRISPSCIPWNPVRERASKPAPAPDRDVLAEIEQIILAEEGNPQRMRLLIGMALWDCGRKEAAEKLGISRATAYRAVSPVRQNCRSPRDPPAA